MARAPCQHLAGELHSARPGLRSVHRVHGNGVEVCGQDVEGPKIKCREIPNRLLQVDFDLELEVQAIGVELGLHCDIVPPTLVLRVPISLFHRVQCRERGHHLVEKIRGRSGRRRIWAWQTLRPVHHIEVVRVVGTQRLPQHCGRLRRVDRLPQSAAGGSAPASLLRVPPGRGTGGANRATRLAQAPVERGALPTFGVERHARARLIFGAHLFASLEARGIHVLPLRVHQQTQVRGPRLRHRHHAKGPCKFAASLRVAVEAHLALDGFGAVGRQWILVVGLPDVLRPERTADFLRAVLHEGVHVLRRGRGRGRRPGPHVGKRLPGVGRLAAGLLAAAAEAHGAFGQVLVGRGEPATEADARHGLPRDLDAEQTCVGQLRVHGVEGHRRGHSEGRLRELLAVADVVLEVRLHIAGPRVVGDDRGLEDGAVGLERGHGRGDLDPLRRDDVLGQRSEQALQVEGQLAPMVALVLPQVLVRDVREGERERDKALGLLVVRDVDHRASSPRDLAGLDHLEAAQGHERGRVGALRILLLARRRAVRLLPDLPLAEGQANRLAGLPHGDLIGRVAVHRLGHIDLTEVVGHDLEGDDAVGDGQGEGPGAGFQNGLVPGL
mmetsp:Transcript_123774/g.396131  ORF Transcript_123774/g.396131 Transcript_123774/m.396131 type:complete len:611 (-) Transcript_123774:493-2325(-)